MPVSLTDTVRVTVAVGGGVRVPDNERLTLTVLDPDSDRDCERVRDKLPDSVIVRVAVSGCVSDTGWQST